MVEIFNAWIEPEGGGKIWNEKQVNKQVVNSYNNIRKWKNALHGKRERKWERWFEHVRVSRNFNWLLIKFHFSGGCTVGTRDALSLLLLLLLVAGVAMVNENVFIHNPPIFVFLPTYMCMIIMMVTVESNKPSNNFKKYTEKKKQFDFQSKNPFHTQLIVLFANATELHHVAHHRFDFLLHPPTRPPSLFQWWTIWIGLCPGMNACKNSRHTYTHKS